MRFRDMLVVVILVTVVAAAISTLPYFTVSGTGLATQATFSLCVNQPPNIDYSACNTSLLQNQYYACSLNVTDIDDPPNFTYYATNVTGNLQFNVTEAGVITAQPDNDLVGLHTIDLIATDLSECVNKAGRERVTFEVINVNDPPIFIPPLGPLEWELGETVRGVFLNNNFEDPDGDAMTFSHSNPPGDFLVSIGEFGELILTASDCGEGAITVTATDTFNASTTSPPVELSVPCPIDSVAAGGSGGGGQVCNPIWECTDWGQCFVNGTQSKDCVDATGCEDPYTFWRECTYVPQCSNGLRDANEEGVDCGGPCPICKTCSDGIQNQGESGVDCGGPCPTCMNCFDGIRNFGEVKVDCGGPCPACATCFDGIQNQDETGVDCGGSCPACTELQTPSPLRERSNPYLPWVLGGIAVLGLLAFAYRVFYKQLHQVLARLAFYFQRHRRKEILLTVAERDALLDELVTLESKEWITNSSKESRARYQDELAAILRKTSVVILGPVFTLLDAEEKVNGLRVAKIVKQVIRKQYIQLLSLEQDGVMDELMLALHTEIARQRIFGFAEVDKGITRRPVEAKKVKGAERKQVLSLLYNTYLALQFGKVSTARQHYLHALSIYDVLTAPEQSMLFGVLHLAFDDIKYVSSYT